MPPILYEDENVLVLDKPAGLSVHGDGKSGEKTLADILLEEYPELKNVGEPFVVERGTHNAERESEEDSRSALHAMRYAILRPGIVHRLDKDTSGVMIVAKNQPAFEFLKEQFSARTTEKIYYAYTYGWLKNDRGTINMPIGRTSNDIRMWTAGRGKRGTIREARTDYEVIKRRAESGKGTVEMKEKKGSTEEGTYTFVKLMPKTGRTHQLRVHMKYLNHPIVADPIYASNRLQALGFSRLALHASLLSIKLPGGKQRTFEAPFPEDFKKAENLEK